MRTTIMMEEYIDFVSRSVTSYDRNDCRDTLMRALWFGRSFLERHYFPTPALTQYNPIVQQGKPILREK